MTEQRPPYQTTDIMNAYQFNCPLCRARVGTSCLEEVLDDKDRPIYTKFPHEERIERALKLHVAG